MSAFKVTPESTEHALTMLHTVAISAEQLRAALAHKDARIGELESEVAEWMKCARVNQEMLNIIGRQLGGKIPEQLVSEVARQCVDRIAELEAALAATSTAPAAMTVAIRFEILGDVCLEPVIGERFEINGSKEVFAVHGSTYIERTTEGFYWSATHVKTGLRIAKGNDIDAIIAEARAVWLSKTPDELEQAIAAGRSRRASAWAVTLTEADMAGSAL